MKYLFIFFLSLNVEAKDCYINVSVQNLSGAPANAANVYNGEVLNTVEQTNGYGFEVNTLRNITEKSKYCAGTQIDFTLGFWCVSASKAQIIKDIKTQCGKDYDSFVKMKIAEDAEKVRMKIASIHAERGNCLQRFCYCDGGCTFTDWNDKESKTAVYSKHIKRNGENIIILPVPKGKIPMCKYEPENTACPRLTNFYKYEDEK